MMMIQGDIPGHIMLDQLNDNRPPPPPPPARPQPPPFEMQRPLSIDDHAGAGTISCINKRLTKRARRLCIYDAASKLRHADSYDIGGTYAEEYIEDDLVPELWFFFSTTVCPGHNYLLNVFVCHRRPGSFTVGLSSTLEMIHKRKTPEKPGQTFLPDTLSWHAFRNTQPEEYFHIKTYCFSENDLKAIENNILIIPIRIEMHAPSTPNNEVVKQIKLNHDFGDILANQEKTDFVLISMSQKQYPVHKIFLAAHSPILRNLIKSKSELSEDNHAFLDITDSEMELLLQFIYTGTIKDILNQNCLKLLQIADRFRLKNLYFLTQFALGEQINVNNAVEIASISEQYKLEKLQVTVFNFIKNNPKVLETEGWKNLNDVHLAKKLFQCMHTKKD